MKRKKNYIDELTSNLSPERVGRAKKDAEEEIFRIRLSELRKQMGIRQEDIKSFSQSAISKLESRTDMKVSTLIEYLNDIGMGVEIHAYPKHTKGKGISPIVLLKI